MSLKKVRNGIEILKYHCSRLIVAKLLLECDRLLGNALSSQRKIINGSRIVLPFDKDDILYQFDFSVETFVSSNSPLKAFENPKSSECQELPSIYPLKCNISVPTSHLYRKQLVYRKCSGRLRLWLELIFMFLVCSTTTEV